MNHPNLNFFLPCVKNKSMPFLTKNSLNNFIFYDAIGVKKFPN